MALRCFLFSSDEETTARVRQILSGIGVQAEFCSDAVVAVDRITNQPFQIVIIDWDKQPEAGLLLTTARERKAAERPITLAIVSDDPSVPRALQAGANSVLRKPIVAAQAKDTLTTARDLLHAKQGSAANAAAAGTARSSAPASLPASFHPAQEKPLRSGEFLQSAPVSPGGQFETEPDASASLEQLPAAEIDPLKDLEPVAASVAQNKPAEPPPSSSNDGRGLEWYLKNRVAARPAGATPASPAQRGNPDLLGYDQTPYSPPPAEPEPVKPAPLPKLAAPALPKPVPDVPSWQEQKKEAELFSYIESGSDPSEARPPSGSRVGKRAIVAALLLAAFAVGAAPQAPWHSKMKGLWANGRQAMHVWLNPQPVTPPQAPAAHENFYRAGDEYKLPVAENIPDATTDPTQIKVLPVVDPTAKKPNNDAGGADPSSAQTDTPAADQPQAPPTPDNQAQSPSTAAPTATSTAPPIFGPAATAPHPDAIATPKTSAPALPKPSPSHTVTPPGNVPSSLKSQLASMTPDASGNKLPETALPSIEPVNVPEAAERALLTNQPAILYPAYVKGDQGTVVLQVLIGRDGTVQDVKFLQGSLAFARAAIDGVKQWKFKPYSMNGRPVSVQTLLTMKFKPGQ
ncbi:MAG: TonB family protein [Candidatus Sulfotelmatobacter sp.]